MGVSELTFNPFSPGVFLKDANLIDTSDIEEITKKHGKESKWSCYFTLTLKAFYKKLQK